MTQQTDAVAAARGRRPRSARWGALAIVPALLVGALALAPASTAATGKAHAATISPSSYVARQLLVRFDAGVDAKTAARLNAGLGARTLKVFPFVPGLELVELRPGASAPAAASSFGALSQVRYAQPNWVSHIDVDSPVRVSKMPNDPRYGTQWDWPKINAPAAWNLTTGSKKVVVGDIDTGMDYKHEDLKKNAWLNTAECNGTAGVDDDGNGYVDDCHGIDTINGDSNPMDDAGHGTHTAGTIGAVGNNGVGVTGLNWRIHVLPCKSHDASGNGSVASIIECYQYMVTEKAAGYDIIATNNSYGDCPEACGFAQATKDGIAAMGDAGILFAAAAANNGQDNDVIPLYPADYFLPNVIPVAATSSSDGFASFSNYGDRTVLVGAPGVGVLSTWPHDAYASLSGTSMATPHVAGLAALIHASDPSLDIYQIRNLIVSSGDDVSSLTTRTVSGKRINAANALACSGSKVFGMLRPLDSESAGKLTIAALNINCDAPAGGVTVKIKPGNVNLTLADQGRKGDLRSGDGIYSVFWNATPGNYTLTFSTGKSYTVKVT
jgi:subtilisin family serine protease